MELVKRMQLDIPELNNDLGVRVVNGYIGQNKLSFGNLHDPICVLLCNQKGPKRGKGDQNYGYITIIMIDKRWRKQP
jgi:hypothetical protein